MTEYSDLTRNQQLIVDSYVEAERQLGRDPTLDEVADRAYDTCDNSYVWYVMDNYGEVLDNRRRDTQVIAADGEGSYLFELGSTDTWKAIRLLPEELSQKIYDQVREQ